MQKSMATNSTTMHPSLTNRFTSKFRDYYTLTKPEVNLLILMTTSAAYYLASRGPFRIVGLINTLVGTLFVASGTATLNQWMERVWDGQMRRTANRPLPSGRLSAREALIFGILLSFAGGLYLAFAVNGLAALLAIFHTTFVSACLYSAKAEDPTMHFGRGFSRRNASSDRLGRSFREYRPKRLVLVRYCISLAVPTFPRNCLDVPERLRAGGL